MANLHVQPKRKNYLWLWILVILIIAAALYYYFNYYKKGETPSVDTGFRQSPALQIHPYARPVVQLATAYTIS